MYVVPNQCEYASMHGKHEELIKNHNHALPNPLQKVIVIVGNIETKESSKETFHWKFAEQDMIWIHADAKLCHHYWVLRQYQLKMVESCHQVFYISIFLKMVKSCKIVIAAGFSRQGAPFGRRCHNVQSNSRFIILGYALSISCVSKGHVREQKSNS